VIPALLVLVLVFVGWSVACCVWSIVVPERRAWPPSKRIGVVYHVSAIVGPALNFPLVALSILGWDTAGFHHWSRFAIGGAPFALGAYLALGGVFRLGMHRTQGYEGELEAAGPYRLSRNPQYVGATLAYFGLAVSCNSAPGLLGAAIASVWFLLLPFAEEPWLRAKLGQPYEDYVSKVPRDLSFRALVRLA